MLICVTQKLLGWQGRWECHCEASRVEKVGQEFS